MWPSSYVVSQLNSREMESEVARYAKTLLHEASPRFSKSAEGKAEHDTGTSRPDVKGKVGGILLFEGGRPSQSSA